MNQLTAIILTILINFTNLHAQSSNPLPNLEPVSILPVSPNNAALGNYVQLPISSYTGIPDINIPLWQASLGDINLPLVLSYHSGGIKVDEISSWVGLGWSLNAGGSISRSVRGLIDSDTFSYLEINKYANNLMTLNERVEYLESILRGDVDSEPDMYYLNVNGISCQFYLSSNGNYVTLPLDINLKIERPSKSRWIVTDNKGIKYTFTDGEHTEVEYNLGGSSQSISAWNVTHIEDTKGNIMYFAYNNESYQYYNKAVEKVRVYDNSASTCGGLEFIGLFGYNNISALSLSSIKYNGTEILFNSKITERSDLTGGFALDYIQIRYNNEIIKKYRFFTSYFNNNTNGTTSNRYYLYSEMDKYRLKLDSLREESISESLPPYKFQYIEGSLPYRLSNSQDDWGYYNGIDNYDFVTYVQNSTEKGANKKIDPLFSRISTLNKIVFPTGGYRVYEYEGNQVPGTGSAISYKTFFNFYGSNSSHRPGDDKDEFIETVEIDFSELKNNQPITFRVAYTIEDEPNSDCSFEFFLLRTGYSPIVLLQNQVYTVPSGIYTLMGKIIQPTENPQERYPVSYYLTLSGDVADSTDYKQRQLGPGIRIKKITNYNDDVNVGSKIFSYTSPLNGISSGFLGNSPSYKTTFTAEREFSPNCQYTEFSSISNYPLINTKSSYVGYNYVTESMNEGETIGKKITQYTNFDQFSDLNSSTEFPYKPQTSQAWKRGLPISEMIYGKSNETFILKQKKKYIYQVLPYSLLENRGVKVGSMKSYLYSFPTDPVKDQIYIGDVYEISTDAFKLIKDTLEIYENTGELKSSNSYYYDDDYFQLNKVITKDSKQDLMISEAKYPIEMVNSSNDPIGIYQNMVSKNMVSFPVEKIETKANNVVSKSKIDYGNPNPNQYLPVTYKSWNRESDLDEIELVYNIFDKYGNPLEVEKRDGVFATYLWGYNNQHLLAEIVGARFSNVNLVVDTALINSVTTTDSQIRAELNKLRTDIRTNSAMTTSFTYKPLIGMTTKTDANNRTIFYEYDAFNRLVLIRDQDNKVLKKFCYNYAGKTEDCTSPSVYSNVLKSGEFIKNNCGTSSSGSHVTYTVPEGTYVSNISIEDANALAQADVNNNGQNYANSNGYCSSTFDFEVSINYSNLSNQIGFVAVYTSSLTNQSYSFNIPPSGSGHLGYLRSGQYSLLIFKAPEVNPVPRIFDLGCATVYGTDSVYLPDMVYVGGYCDDIIIDLDL